jgi:hypothetical protein
VAFQRQLQLRTFIQETIRKNMFWAGELERKKCLSNWRIFDFGKGLFLYIRQNINLFLLSEAVLDNKHWPNLHYIPTILCLLHVLRIVTFCVLKLTYKSFIKWNVLESLNSNLKPRECIVQTKFVNQGVNLICKLFVKSSGKNIYMVLNKRCSLTKFDRGVR